MRAALLAGLVALAACGGSGAQGALVLDGSPRIPDDEGVATALDFGAITLDDARTYDISDELRSFSTYTLAAEPMITRRGQYVQVGLAGDTVVWIAGIAAVVPQPDGSDAVFYAGRLAEDWLLEGGRAAFIDGTTFEVAPGMTLDGNEDELLVRIDVSEHRIAAVGAGG